MAGQSDLTRDVDIDIAGLMREVAKRWWLVLAAPLIAGAGLFFALSTMEPSYQSSARIIIEKRESVFTRRSDGDFTLSGSQFDEQAVGSQVQVLTSTDLALKVIARLKLTEHPEFAGKGPSMIGDLLALAGGSGPVELSAEERILADFNKRLSVYAIEKSRVIAVEFWAHDRDLAQAVPNALADEYLELTKAAQLQTTGEAAGWLGTEIEQLREKVRISEAKVAEYRASSDILVGNNNALLATQQLSETASELSRVRSERSAAEGKADAIRAALEQGASIDTLPEVISSPLIQRLREREASLAAEISELETTLLPNHPRLKALKSQVNDFQDQIRTSARNILKSLESNVDLLRKQEAILLQEVNRLKVEAGRVGEAEVELRALEREATAQRELLETYLTRFREAASRQNNDYLPVDARIISRAVTPAESFFPKVVPFTAAGMAAALVLTVTGILAWALLAGKAFRQAEYLPYPLPERDEMPYGERERMEEASWQSPAAPAEPEDAPQAEQPPQWRQPAQNAPEIVFPLTAVDAEETSDRSPELARRLLAETEYEDARDSGDSAGYQPMTPARRSLSEVYTLPPKEDVDAWREITKRIDADADSYAGKLEAALEGADSRPSLGAQTTASETLETYGQPEIFAAGDILGLLQGLDRARVAMISPAGDEGSVLTWKLVRDLAAAGRSVLLVDLTGSAVTSAEFAGSTDAPGLREVLAGTVLLRNAIVRDHASRALVLPAGVVEREGLFAHLPETAGALAKAFDFIFFDCGIVGAEGVGQIASKGDIVIVSAIGAEAHELAETEAELRLAGFTEAVVADLDEAVGAAAVYAA